MIALILLALFAVVAVVGWINLRRHGQSDHAASTWQPTEELFRDPSSGKLTRVWIDPADGSRHYIPDRSGGPLAP